MGVRVCCLHDVRCINVNTVAMLLAPMVCRHVRFQYIGIANKDLGGRNAGNLLYFLVNFVVNLPLCVCWHECRMFIV